MGEEHSQAACALLWSPGMNHELWIRLRRLQKHPGHVTYRGLLQSALLEGVSCWARLVERFAESGIDLRGLENSTPEPLDVVQAEAERLHRLGATLLTPASPEYPATWLAAGDPALTLTVRGHLSALSSPSLAVVGSREPSSESLRWMETELATFCRTSKAVIVSGGARGIDQKAHAVALRAGSPTIMFLPSGLEVPYPADISRWFNAVFDGGGAVVSEYPAAARMRKEHFHQRNRLIAAAARAVLIIEARERSGTLITAARAAEIGRPLWTLPGHPGDVRFAGNLGLLKEQATMICQSEDLLGFWSSEQDPANFMDYR